MNCEMLKRTLEISLLYMVEPLLQCTKATTVKEMNNQISDPRMSFYRVWISYILRVFSMF